MRIENGRIKMGDGNSGVLVIRRTPSIAAEFKCHLCGEKIVDVEERRYIERTLEMPGCRMYETYPRTVTPPVPAIRAHLIGHK